MYDITFEIFQKQKHELKILNFLQLGGIIKTDTTQHLMRYKKKNLRTNGNSNRVINSNKFNLKKVRCRCIPHKVIVKPFIVLQMNNTGSTAMMH